MRPTWDQYGLKLAQVAAIRAACTRRQVGAVILSTDHRVVSCGYNGVTSGETHCTDGGCPRGLLSYDECPELGSYANCNGRHAEPNAIDNAMTSVEGYTIYVTRAPCTDCFQLIRDAGIARVVYVDEEGRIYDYAV